MKVLWYINCVLPFFKNVSKSGKNFGCPWGDALIRYHGEKNEFDLAVASPEPVDDLYQTEKKGIRYYAFPDKSPKVMKKAFIRLLKNEKPDVIHIWGTESSYSYIFFTSCEELHMVDRVCVHIQGLVSVYANHIRASLPVYVVYGVTPKDFLRRSSIRETEKSFRITGKLEEEILRRAKHILGRTEWDRACSELLNEKASFHYSREMMRDSFFHEEWNYGNCEKHSIFMRGGGWCIKGLHYVLKAMPLILEKYPDTKLYVASGGLEKRLTGSFKDRMKASYYDRYILSEMNRLGIRDKVVLLDQMDDEGMRTFYKKANVFISASTIENSCNCLLEARLIGTPAIASFAGGTPSSVQHGVTGYLYQHDAFYMIAHYVLKIFNAGAGIESLSRNEREWAHEFADRDSVYQELLSIYEGIANA